MLALTFALTLQSPGPIPWLDPKPLAGPVFINQNLYSLTMPRELLKVSTESGEGRANPTAGFKEALLNPGPQGLDEVWHVTLWHSVNICGKADLLY